MRLSFRTLAGCLLAIAACTACSTERPTDNAWTPPVSGVDASIRFEASGTLKLAPRQVAEVTIATEPPARYRVSFLMVGGALDASLDRSSVITDDEGRATVRLRAPNQASAFALRASIEDGVSAELSVAVSDLGFGSLLIEPRYMGSRTADSWQARVVVGTTCAALAPTFPDDPPGALKGSSDWGTPVAVDVAPVGPNLAVFVRAAQYMWGCSDESRLKAGETQQVDVHIADKPVDTSEVLLDIDMAFSPDPVGWQPIVESERALLLDTFFGVSSYATVGAMIDDTMMQLSGDPAGYQAASGGLWAQDIQAHLDNHQIDLSALLVGFSDDALANQPAELIGKVQSVGKAQGQALFTLVRMNQVSAARLGVPPEYVTSLTVDAQDKARLGGSLFWLPSRYIGALIEDEAMAQLQASSFGQALSDLAMCDELSLGGFGACDDSCIQELCADALAYRWTLALDASADNLLVGEIPFEASGQSHLDDAAFLKGFDGSWLGEVRSGALKAKVQGAVSAQPSGPPAAAR